MTAISDTLPTPALSIQDIRKSYGDVKAVSGISLNVYPGEIYGFLGRNGAGKTTTIRVVLGLVKPDAGDSSIFGASIRSEREKALSYVGFLVETASAYPRLTVIENLEIERILRRAPKDSVHRSIERTGLEPYAHKKAGTLSLGNKQRLSLARALLSDAPLLILDEPANGLDPAGIVEIRDLLSNLARTENRAIFMSSHILGEVAILADRIGIVHNGKLVEEISRDDAESSKSRIEVAVDDPVRAQSILESVYGSSFVGMCGGQTLLVNSPDADPREIARSLVGSGIGIERLVKNDEALEERFMRLTGGNS